MCVEVTAFDGNRLMVKGTEKNNMKSISFQATKDPQALLTPSIMSLKQAGINSTATITPTWVVRQVNP